MPRATGACGWAAVLPLALLPGFAACAGAPAHPVPDRGEGVWIGAGASACLPAITEREGADADADGLSDACEHALAAAFAPELRADAAECAWDAGLARLTGGYLYAAQPTAGGRAVRIAYLPAYPRDCGWSGPQCVLTPGACRPHGGDSEIVVVEAAPAGGDAGRWETVGVFLSAHCHGRSDGRCRWYRGRALRRFAWVDGRARGAPVVWVARGKHGNYPTRAACETGHWLYDTCERNRAAYRFPVVSPAQNLGSRRRPGGPRGDGCIRAGELPWGAGTAAEPGAEECFWSADRPFRGWRTGARGDAPAPYERYLRERAGF